MTEEEINQLKEQLASAQQEITKWKFKFNSKNADYILLHEELEKLKNRSTNPLNSSWFYLLLALLALAFWYFFSP